MNLKCLFGIHEWVLMTSKIEDAYYDYKCRRCKKRKVILNGINLGEGLE